jgi:hypothetical protein
MIAPSDRLSVVLQDGSTFTAPGTAQLFTFSREGREDLVFCVAKLIALHAEQPGGWETIVIDLVPEDARMIQAERGIEQAQLARISRQLLEEPGYGVFLEDGSFLLVDGNHLYVKRLMSGRTTMTFHTCRFPTWEGALLDMPATRKRLDARNIREDKGELLK